MRWCVVILIATLVGVWLWCRGRRGRVLAAIQDNELKLQSLGYDTAGLLLVVFVAVGRAGGARRRALRLGVRLRRARPGRAVLLDAGHRLGGGGRPRNAARADHRRRRRHPPAERDQQLQLEPLADRHRRVLHRAGVPLPRGPAALRRAQARQTLSEPGGARHDGRDPAPKPRTSAPASAASWRWPASAWRSAARASPASSGRTARARARSSTC